MNTLPERKHLILSLEAKIQQKGTIEQSAVLKTNLLVNLIYFFKLFQKRLSNHLERSSFWEGLQLNSLRNRNGACVILFLGRYIYIYI